MNRLNLMPLLGGQYLRSSQESGEKGSHPNVRELPLMVYLAKVEHLKID